MDATTARRFPLIARPRPPCTPLPHRIAELHALADKAITAGDLATASAVFNRAALIASDCGDHDLARHWCHRLARAALGRPHPGKNALEPIVNLARLRIRASDGTTAWTMLETLHQAVTDHTTITIDDITIATSDLAPTPKQHRELRRWTWTVLIGTGAHALASANHWDEARQRLEQHHGIGKRMLDGRQVAVISHALAGRHDNARRLLDTTAPGEAWEEAVTDCLTRLCDTDRRTAQKAFPREPDPSQLLYWTRLHLSFLDAIGNEGPEAAALATEVLRHAHHDGYAAREVLAHPLSHAFATQRERRRLWATTTECALDYGKLPADALNPLTQILDMTEKLISATTGE